MHFLNVHHCYDSVGRLIRALGGESPDEASIHAAYREAIAQVRPVAPSVSGITVSYEDGAWGQYLLDAHVFEDIFVGISGSSPAERELWARQVNDAVAYIRSLNSDLGRIIDLLVTDVVVLNSERTGGGSASHLPGLVCISPGARWEMVDYAESIMHEGTHLNLFVADSVHGIYTLPTSALGEEQYRVLSAVKVGERRPLDKAFHSAAVAVPLMYMQQLRGQTTLVDEFAVSLLECAVGLLDKADVFTDYGRLLVEELHRFAQTTDFDYVVKSISSTEYASC
jgi:HEXXH motif-containing protein